MAEQSDSTTKAPKSSYKQLDELAQKHRVAVSIFLQVIYLKYYTFTDSFAEILRTDMRAHW